MSTLHHAQAGVFAQLLSLLAAAFVWFLAFHPSHAQLRKPEIP